MHTKTYEKHFIEDSNKKNFKDSVAIKEGKTFSINSEGNRGGMFVNNNRYEGGNNNGFHGHGNNHYNNYGSNQY